MGCKLLGSSKEGWLEKLIGRPMMLNSIFQEILNAPESAQIAVIALTGIHSGFRVAETSKQVAIMIAVITLVAIVKI
jgi:hypothetical protein